ncbi:MAG: D-TA family PLP-dependent enzyme [Gemmatimonadetes bacterium]|nr:D-TA family PLP-dependent enzyme [Gemmatimonadota bacterium]
MSLVPPSGLRTPALLLDLGAVDQNLDAMIRAVGGTATRWRPHVKTAKLGAVMQRMVRRGLTRFKCATTLELSVALEAGATDVLVAFPHVGANAARIVEIARAHPTARVSGLVETETHVDSWRDSGLALFADLNSGMNRTGGVPDAPRIVALARAITGSGCTFGGLHWYDGHMHGLGDLGERERAAHAGYRALGALVTALAAAGVRVPEVIVAGTPAAVPAASYREFKDWPSDVQLSPGTVVYNDLTSLSQIPEAWGLAAAVHVLATVVSHPTPTRFTCDAGHKAVSADAGVPTCAVVGHPEWTPTKPSEEHLPIDVPPGTPLPAIGTQLMLLPVHVCPTVNNFDDAVAHEKGAGWHRLPVTARGREAPVGT